MQGRPSSPTQPPSSSPPSALLAMSFPRSFLCPSAWHSCTLPRLQLGLLSRWPPNPPSGCSLLQIWVLYLQIPLAAPHPGGLQQKFLKPDSTKQPPSCRGWASAHHAPILSHLGLFCKPGLSTSQPVTNTQFFLPGPLKLIASFLTSSPYS